MARIETKSEFAGVGCAIQGVGLLCLIFWPIGTIIGIVLLLVGSAKSFRTICSECRNPVASKQVKLCPTCKAEFS